MKLIHYNEDYVSTVDTDGLVPWHQGISRHRAEYALMDFQLLLG